MLRISNKGALFMGLSSRTEKMAGMGLQLIHYLQSDFIAIAATQFINDHAHVAD
jgi:hypothetical protein